MLDRTKLKAEKLQYERAIILEDRDFLEPTKLKLLRQYTRRLKKVKQDLKRYFNE
jgi:hypothetical protein